MVQASALFSAPLLFAVGVPQPQEASPVASEATSASCAYGEWEPLRVLQGLPEGSVMRQASLALYPSGGYAVGMDVPEFDRERPLERLAWNGLRLDGERIPAPAGDRFHYMTPRAAADGQGRLHAVWGHDDTLSHPTPYEVTARYPTSLW
jgi:hypothetical protein